MTNIEEMVYNYHNLAGTMMKEKRKSLNIFLKEVQSKTSTENELNALIYAIGPENNQEERLMIDILIHFKKYPQLLCILKTSENPILIGKILKCWNFFEETFKTINPNELVNDILPNTSFFTRTKIINRLSKNLKDEKLADDFFKAVEEKYGLKVATPLLCACSLALIGNRVTKYNIKLSNRQLMQIIKKRMEFLTFYFDILCKAQTNLKISITYSPVIKYVAKVDLKLFWTLSEKYKLNIKFGRHTTTRLLENKKELIKNHEKCTNFAKKQIYNLIRKDDNVFKSFFLSFYPRDVETFRSHCLYENSPINIFLKFVSKPNRYVLLNNYFKEVYGCNLHDEPKCAIRYALSIMPQDIREIVLEKKVKEEEHLIYMFNIKKSIPAIKERIKHTSDIDFRNNYITLLYKTCEFNKDDVGLLEVLKYLLSRHKNDTNILYNFMRNLTKWSNLDKLSDEHWILIKDILNILEISKNTLRNFDLSKLEYMEKYFVHLYETDQSVEEHVNELFKYIVEAKLDINFRKMNQKFQKVLLEIFGKFVLDTLEGEERIVWSKKFLLRIIRFNEQNIDKISILNYIDLLAYHKTVKEIVRYCVKNRVEGYDSIFWENYKTMYHHDVIMWYTKEYPQKIVENFQQILDTTDFSEKVIDDLIFTLNELLPNSNIQEKLIKFINEVIQKEEYEKGKCAIGALSHLAKCEEFLKVIEPLIPPTDGQIDIKENKKVHLQQCVVKNLVNLKHPSATLKILLKFCKGDYLKYALPPLYAITSRTQETNLPDFFAELFNSAVSVRKHVITLKKILLPQEEIYLFLQQQASKEKHSSLQKVIFTKTLEYFIQNPSEKFWNLLRDNMNIIDKEDTEAHNILLTEMKNIPFEYLPQYIPIVYEKFSINPNDIIKINKFSLLPLIPDQIIKKLDVDFLKRTIDETLFNPEIQHNESKFCFRCIFHNSDEVRHKLFDHTFEIFRKYVGQIWSPCVYGEQRQTVYSFVSSFCTNFLRFKAEMKLIQEFFVRWSQIFKIEEAIEEYLVLEFTSAYRQSEQLLNEFAPKVNHVLNKLIDRYDFSIIHIYSQVLTRFINILDSWSKKDNLPLFLESFIYPNPTKQIYIVACNLLKEVNIFGDNKQTYEKIIGTIQQCQDSTVQLHYGHLLKIISN